MFLFQNIKEKKYLFCSRIEQFLLAEFSNNITKKKEEISPENKEIFDIFEKNLLLQHNKPSFVVFTFSYLLNI